MLQITLARTHHPHLAEVSRLEATQMRFTTLLVVVLGKEMNLTGRVCLIRRQPFQRA